MANKRMNEYRTYINKERDYGFPDHPIFGYMEEGVS